ncbi:MAG: DivIVA domain-containing protein [Thermotogae bacterium]|nr:DivIVA domain-containing protein [Thermotogota bacterium]
MAKFPKRKKSLSSIVKTQEFRLVGGLGKKGYDPEEVKAFLNRIARQIEELEKKVEVGGEVGAVSEEVILQYEEKVKELEERIGLLLKENAALKRKLEEAETRGSGAAFDWDSIPEEKLATQLLRMAKEAGDRTVEEKRKEAEKILRDAQIEAERILREAQLKEADLQRKLSILKAELSEIEEKRKTIYDSIKKELLNIARKVEQLAADLE